MKLSDILFLAILTIVSPILDKPFRLLIMFLLLSLQIFCAIKGI